MFKAKDYKTKQIYQVLSVQVVQPFNMTQFLIWENAQWKWAPAERFVPPNYEGL